MKKRKIPAREFRRAVRESASLGEAYYRLKQAGYTYQAIALAAGISIGGVQSTVRNYLMAVERKQLDKAEKKT